MRFFLRFDECHFSPPLSPFVLVLCTHRSVCSYVSAVCLVDGLTSSHSKLASLGEISELVMNRKNPSLAFHPCFQFVFFLNHSHAPFFGSASWLRLCSVFPFDFHQSFVIRKPPLLYL